MAKSLPACWLMSMWLACILEAEGGAHWSCCVLAHLSRQVSTCCTSPFMLCRWRSELEAARTLETEEKYRQYAGILSGHLQACEAILSQVSWVFWEQKKPVPPRIQLLASGPGGHFAPASMQLAAVALLARCFCKALLSPSCRPACCSPCSLMTCWASLATSRSSTGRSASSPGL